MIASPSVLPGNILSLADSDFETGSPTWGADTNATAVGAVTAYAFTGTHAWEWTATAAGDSIVATGFYSCNPNQGYDFSGLILSPVAGHDAYIGVRWYTSGSSLITTTWGSDYPTSAGTWQTFNVAAGAPSNAAKFKVVAWASTSVQPGEPFAIDLMYAAQTDVQILIDWINPAFAPQSQAGNDYFDVTPWVRIDNTVSVTRGRQQAIAEVQTGTAQFTLENDTGWFTPFNSNSPVAALGGSPTLGARCQINLDDQTGNFWTRFDGPVSEIDYTIDTTSNTDLASVSVSDVLAYLNRSDSLQCWTKEAVLASGPWLHWALDDADNTGSLGNAAETSGNNGPVLHAVPVNLPSGQTASITWHNSNGGIETLADAAKPGQPDMSEYWIPGSDVSSGVSGLDSGGVGPYSTPLASAYFAPYVSLTTQNAFTGSAGYTLIGELTRQAGYIAPTSAGANYAVEAWFAMDPTVTTEINKATGPFTVISLGQSRQGGGCLTAGIVPGTTSLVFQVAVWPQPPAFAMNNWSTAPVPTVYINYTMAKETVPLPHHVVLNITGSSTAPIAELWIDGNNAGSISLAAGGVYDTICVGGAYGGWGCFYGNIQLASIYQRNLSNAEIQQHCDSGQYGMWESTTDNCIAQLAEYSGIPSFWNNLVAQNNGLSLTDYYDITNATALASMQVYEQAEQGLLFVPASGALSFSTRDWRQGYGAPDLLLPPDVYNAALQYQLIDQYIINQAAVSTPTYQTGVAQQNAASSGQFGAYANGTAQSPTQLPLITWNRAYTALGMAPYSYWPDPCLNDNVLWQVNSRANPRLTYGSLTVDLLTLDPLSGITISQLYGLDINNMIGLSGTLPASLANATGANELFIEGVNETLSLSARTLTFYTSPANVQRAWIPGDPVYGQLGTTSLVGVSQPDVSVPQALGKDVSHDAGGPYWPPQFGGVQPTGTYQVGFVNFTGTSGSFAPNVGLGRSYQGDCLLVEVQCPAASTITVSDTESNAYTQIASKSISGVVQYIFASVGTAPLSTADTVTITGSVSQAYSCAQFGLQNVLAVDAAPVYNNGTGTSMTVTGHTMSASTDLEVVVFFNNSTLNASLATGWTIFGNNVSGAMHDTMYYRTATSTAADACSATLSTSAAWGAIALSFTLQPSVMNNPADNGHQFIGGLEMRGLVNTLQTALQPPMAIVEQAGHNQAMPNGTNAAPQINWDTVLIDTASGMAAAPGWSNWYVCLVPGFYEINAQVGYAYRASGAAGSRLGYIVVAQQAAQALAAGTGSPQTVAAYACPVGEQHTANSLSVNPVVNAGTRIYLGLGDMVTLGTTQNQGAADSTMTSYGGNFLSLRWCGYSTANDQVMINSSMGGPGTVTVNPGGSSNSSGPVAPKTHQISYTASSSYSYYGTQGSESPQLRNTSGDVYQGQYSGGSAAGTQFGFVVFNWTAIRAALSGATIKAIWLKCSNVDTWYSSGGTLILGWSSRTSWGSSASLSGSDHPNCQRIGFTEGQTKVFTLGPWAEAFQTTATSLLIGDDSNTALSYYGYWGVPSTWVLTITCTG